MSTADIENIPPNTPLKAANGEVIGTPNISTSILILKERVQYLSQDKKRASLDEWEEFKTDDPEKLLLIEKVKAKLDHPSGWKALLFYELNLWKNTKQEKKDAATKSLRRLYEKATRSINKEIYRKEEDYFIIWVGYAKFLM
jgi:hypothetical protein